MATKKTPSRKKTAAKHPGPKTKASKKQASSKASRSKVEKVMHEYKEGTLHSRSGQGPVVRSRKQAIAIALSEAGASNKKTKRASAARKK